MVLNHRSKTDILSCHINSSLLEETEQMLLFSSRIYAQELSQETAEIFMYLFL